MHFTIEDYKKIERWLKENSVKDTEFPETSELYPNEYLTIIQQGINKKVKLNSLLKFILNNTDSDLDITSTNPVQNQAVTKAIYELQNRKIIKVVDTLPSIDVAESSVIYILLADVGEDTNIFTEWIKVNNTWEKVGEFKADIDLSPYLKIQDSPFEKGSGQNSAVLKGGNNKVISDGSVVLGKDNLVGLKGFYYKHIRFVSNTIANIYLSKIQVLPTITTGGEIKDTTIISANYLSKGDIISIVNDNKYNDVAVINNMSEGMIQIKWLSEAPFTTIKRETNLSPEDYSIYCLDKPSQGISDLGKYSFVNGTDNKAINTYTEVSGKGNVAKGKFGKVWGKDNVGGYNTTTFGSGNVNIADNSLVSGTNNINEGNNSVIHGNKNKNYGKRAFGVGNENITNNENEVAFGKYNNSKNDTQFSIGIGTSDIDRKNAVEVKQNGDIYIEGVEGKIQDKLNAVGQASIISVTYNEIVGLKRDSKLIPGQQYRITDYVTTTVQENTQSALHPFDIIVTADDVNVLNENARAIQHEGDTYFANSDLNAWELKYCLDNDTSRFAWADAENGKGVIYRMIDEFDNECPYDFKNVLFLRNNEWYYTFALGSTDKSLIGSRRCCLNVIKSWFDSSSRKYTLNNNVFIDTNDAADVPCIGNILEHNCYDNTFGANVVWNTIGAYSDNNTFGNAIKHNTTLSRFSNNTLGDEIHHNTFGTQVKNNTLGNYIEHCQFGNGCITNLLASYSRNVIFENGVYRIKLSGPNASENNYLQNYTVCNGLNEGNSTTETIACVRNAKYATYIGKDSSGVIRTFCLADMFDALSQITISETN